MCAATSPEDVLKNVTSFIGDALSGLASVPDKLTDDITKNLLKIIDAIGDNGVSVLKEVEKIQSAAINPKVPQAVDIGQTLTAIGTGLGSIESNLNKVGLVVAEGTIDVEVRVQLPGLGSDRGGMSKIHLVVTPKQQS